MPVSAFSGSRLEFRDVGRRFEGTGQVVEQVSIAIESGEFVALLGPSGCGKSTLLRLAAGLDSPDHGTIVSSSVSGSVPGATGTRGFVFQDAHLLPWRTVLDNAALPLELQNRPRSEARERARAALGRVGLSDALERYPNELSGGMRMRASVARALVTDPQLLLLDEPFAALDENTRFLLQEDLRALWERTRMTVIFVTHSVTEAAYLANRSLVLSPRPARIVLDHRSRLPESRPGTIRTEASFLSEVKTIQEAFRRFHGDQR